ncbi:MAG: GNAT family N-acetyltransferase, partial [Candidatus Marinimicrobia bacterium]|nr:GNAT family N-acetyltransferase [Candidatus Neomarinimicrobiota bacterium]
MHIETYYERDAELWDTFVQESNNGTLFHTRKFLSYHPSDRFKDRSLIFLKKGNPIALLPAADVET